jgi:hypothetical protein
MVGVRPGQVPYLESAARKKMGETDASKINVTAFSM